MCLLNRIKLKIAKPFSTDNFELCSNFRFMPLCEFSTKDKMKYENQLYDELISVNKLIVKESFKMTNEEFREAMNRIAIEQEFKNLKIKEMQINNSKINAMTNEIANKNSLRDKKMTELYGKGPKEAMLERTTRIAGYLGKISNSANNLGIALNTFKKLQQPGDSNTKKEDNKSKNKTKTKSNEKEIVKNLSKVGVENISKKVNDYNKSSLNKRGRSLSCFYNCIYCFL